MAQLRATTYDRQRHRGGPETASATTIQHRRRLPQGLITSTDRRTQRRYSAGDYESKTTEQRSDQQKWGGWGSNPRPDGWWGPSLAGARGLRAVHL